MKMVKNLNKLYFVSFLSSALMLMLVSSVSAEPSTSVSGDFGVIFMYVCCCLCSLVYFILLVYTAIWIYKDAKKLGVDNEILWTVLFLIFPIVFIIYYLVVRKEAMSKLNSSVGSNNVSNTTNTIDANNTDHSGTSTDNSNQN